MGVTGVFLEDMGSLCGTDSGETLGDGSLGWLEAEVTLRTLELAARTSLAIVARTSAGNTSFSSLRQSS